MSDSSPGTSTDLPKPIDILPHRDPFLLVDRLVELESGKQAIGEWKLTGDEWFFPGHFPGRPTLPGVLIVESLAQVGACVVLAEPQFAGKIPLFAGANKVKFRRQVVPGETLTLTVEIGRLSARAGKGRGVATVDGELACEGELLFVIADS